MIYRVKIFTETGFASEFVIEADFCSHYPAKIVFESKTGPEGRAIVAEICKADSHTVIITRSTT